LVVADEDERRPAQDLLAVDEQRHAQKGIAPQRRHHRPREREPFAAAEALLLALAIANDVGVQAEAGVVDEDPAVDLADVDRRGSGRRPQTAASALSHSASQATPSANAATTSLR